MTMGIHALSTNDEDQEDRCGIKFVFLFWKYSQMCLPSINAGKIALYRSTAQKRQRKLEKVRLRLTGYLLDLVNHHKGIRQAHLHWVIDRTDLWHLDRDLSSKKWSQSKKKKVKYTVMWLGHPALAWNILFMMRPNKCIGFGAQVHK